MTTISIRKGFYIKLGKGGEWVKDCLTYGRLRFGWKDIHLNDIVTEKWEDINQQIIKINKTRGMATIDYKRLRDLALATPDDVWITFHDSQLWWCRLQSGPVQEDQISKYRLVQGQWFNTDIQGRALLINQIPGILSKTIGFRATVCSVEDLPGLQRLINGQVSPAFQEIERAKKILCVAVQNGIRNLHWKDFELLVDLIFRQAGWRRISVVGKTMKYMDIELEEPILGERYQVQIKSKADHAEFIQYKEQFHGGAFRKLFFIVHSPSKQLSQQNCHTEEVELILPERLAEMVVDAGLVSWVLNKVS
jgi:hypothetical protein